MLPDVAHLLKPARIGIAQTTNDEGIPRIAALISLQVNTSAIIVIKQIFPGHAWQPNLNTDRARFFQGPVQRDGKF